MVTQLANVHAFHGVRYNQDAVSSLDAAVAPPYDVISPEQKAFLLARNSSNVVRLILPDESPDRDKYSHAAELFREWIDNGVLIQDDESSMYVCDQLYEVGGKTVRRIGLTCLVRLEDYGTGAILPHERVLARPREDRLSLIRATRANFDSVFGLHDAKGVQALLVEITRGAPIAEATDTTGVTCRMWKVSDASLISELSAKLAGEPILIADGHHRYDSALAYRNEVRDEAGATNALAASEFVMMTLVSFEDEGLTILPTHRFVRDLEDFHEVTFLKQLSEFFDVSAIAADDLMRVVVAEQAGQTTLGLYMGNGTAYVLKLKREVDPTKLDIAGSDALKRLDVTILHYIILDGILGIDTRTPEGQAIMAYTRDDDEPISRVDNGEFRVSFVMNTMGVSDVRKVAASGDVMPQKSTFFYPKLLTGMIMRIMD